MKRIALFATFGIASTLTVGCKLALSGSATKDIFAADEAGANDTAGNDRRRPATEDEKLWAVEARGCTGHMLSPDFLLIAAHCAPTSGKVYTSGAAMARGAKDDVSIEKVIERNAVLDYAIAKVKWRDGFPQSQKHTTKIAAKAGDVAVGADAAAGDEVFTVGFPADKGTWGVTYAQGRLRKLDGAKIQYDVGTINGNSGGGVWRKADGMLVSMTNGGPHSHDMQGWRGNDVNDAKAWNYGPAMWEVYAASSYLKKAFPNGSYDAAAERELIEANGGGDDVPPQPHGPGINAGAPIGRRPGGVPGGVVAGSTSTSTSNTVGSNPVGGNPVSGDTDGMDIDAGMPIPGSGDEPVVTGQPVPSTVVSGVAEFEGFFAFPTPHAPADSWGETAAYFDPSRRGNASEPCKLQKAFTNLLSPAGKLQQIALAPMFERAPCAMTDDFWLASTFPLREVSRSVCGVVTYEGSTADVWRVTTLTVIYSVPQPAAPRTIRIEDASTATCTDKRAANFIMTVSAERGEPVKLYGNRMPAAMRNAQLP